MSDCGLSGKSFFTYPGWAYALAAGIVQGATDALLPAEAKDPSAPLAFSVPAIVFLSRLYQQLDLASADEVIANLPYGERESIKREIVAGTLDAANREAEQMRRPLTASQQQDLACVVEKEFSRRTTTQDAFLDSAKVGGMATFTFSVGYGLTYGMCAIGKGMHG